MADMLSSALEYARRGWYVFPCRENPATPTYVVGKRLSQKRNNPMLAKDCTKLHAMKSKFALGGGCGMMP